MSNRSKMRKYFFNERKGCKRAGWFALNNFVDPGKLEDYLKEREVVDSLIFEYLTRISESTLNIPTAQEVKTDLEEALVDEINVIVKGSLKQRIQELTDRIIRYMNYEAEQFQNTDREIIHGPTYIQLDDDRKVRCSVILKVDDNFEIILYENNKPELSSRARNKENKPENDLYLYSMALGAKKFLSEFVELDIELDDEQLITASYYHLRHKDDSKSKNKFEDFDSKINKNIISATYTVNALEDPELKNAKRLDELAEEDLNVFSEMTSKKSTCKNCRFKDICDKVENKSKPNREIVETNKKGPSKLTLTNEQRALLVHNTGVNSVKAGAGVGKTTSIALKIVYLLDKNIVDPMNLLLITFTDKACEEMEEKLKFWGNAFNVRADLINAVTIKTFHSFGLSYIKTLYQELGYSKQPELANQIQVYDTIIEILNNSDENLDFLRLEHPFMNFYNAKGAVVELSTLFTTLNENLFNGMLETIDIYGYANSYMIFDLYNEYKSKLKEKNLLEYQDLIILGNKIFSENAILDPDHLSNKIQVYKDTIEENVRFNEIETTFDEQRDNMLRALNVIEAEIAANEVLENSSERVNLSEKTADFDYVIVDEYQDTDKLQDQLIKSIIDSKNAKLFVFGDRAQSIFGFRGAVPENISNMSNFFGEVNEFPLTTNYRSTPEILDAANEIRHHFGDDESPDLVPSKKKSNIYPELNLDKNSEFLIAEIQDRLNSGLEPHEIAVIARTKKELREIETNLNKVSMPTDLQIKRTLPSEVLSLAHILRSDENKRSALDFFISSVDIETLENTVDMGIEDFYVFLDEFANNIVEHNRKETLIETYYAIIDEYLSDNLLIKEFTDELKEMVFEDFEDLFTHLNKINEYEIEFEVKSSEDIKYNAINLITAHSSKGKEYESVFVLIDQFGKQVDEENDAERKEEERLLYVAITRAKQYLNIVSFGENKKPYFVDNLSQINSLKKR